MAIDEGTSTITTSKQDRNWRTELFQDVDGSEQLRFHRELVATDTATQKVVAQDRTSIPTVQRTSQQVANRSYTASGITARPSSPMNVFLCCMMTGIAGASMAVA